LKNLTTPKIYKFITREINIAKGAYDLDESSKPHESYLCNFMMYQLLKLFSSSKYFAVLMAGG
jgi:pyrrolidone-carboxylate peptidase